MKTTVLGVLIIIAALIFSSCSMTINPDGSSKTSVDSESFLRALDVLTEK